MAGWGGFSDAELRRLKQTETPSNVKHTHSGGLKATKLQKSQTNSATRSSEASAASTSLPNSQRLVHPKPTSMPIPNHALSTGNKIPRNRIAIPQPEGNEISPEIIHIKQEIEDTELNDEEALSREMGNLEKFREQQKMIEEANKQRKALLAKTLSERQRRAREEAQKLAHIQKELQLLDNRLSADVTVIRSRIEVASREFLDAQKRYDKAEREFIESKLDLQKKSELKEQLTEHLYTIIHQNEVRKAQKLSELMTELELEAKEDGVQMTNLPPLATFSTMNALKTLHSPKSQIEKTPLTSDKLVKNLTVEKSDSQTVKEKTNSVSDVATEKLDSNVEVQKGDSVIEASDSTEKRDKDDTKEGNTSKDKEPVIIPIDLSASSPENITEENEGSNVKSPHSEDPNNKGESNISQNGVQDSKSPNQKSDSSGDGQKTDTECKTNTDNSDKSELCIMDVRTVTETESKSNIDSDNEKAQEDIPSTWTLNVVKVKDEPAT